MASSEDQEQRVRQIQRDYVGFLDDSDRENSVYETAIQEMVKGTWILCTRYEDVSSVSKAIYVY